MSTNTQAIPDDIIETAKKSADALITRMCVTMDHSFGLQSEEEQRGLRTSMSQLAEHDIAPAIAKAIHDAVMAERERFSRATPDMIAAAWATWKPRNPKSLGPGPGFVEAINAALAAIPKAEGV